MYLSSLHIIPFSSFSKMQLTTINFPTEKQFLKFLLSSLPPHEGTGDLVINPCSSFSKKVLTTS